MKIPCKNTNFSHGEFVLVNNELKDFDDMIKEIKNLKTQTLNQRFQSNYKTMLSYCLKCRKKTESKNPKVSKTKKRTPKLL